MTEFCSIDRVTYPLPCQQSYMRWRAHSLPPLDTVPQGRRESGLQQMHPEALQNVRKRAFEMLDAGMNALRSQESSARTRRRSASGRSIARPLVKSSR